MNSKEGNLLSFRILVDETGTIVTELSGIPVDKIEKVFKNNEYVVVKKIVTDARRKLKDMHRYLEDELNNLN